MNLAPDADWCKTIIWTLDSRKVGFVIADDRLAVFDVATRALEAFFFLAGTGCCGGPQESRSVAFNEDGTQVSFDRFDRATVLIRPKDRPAFEAPVTRESPDGFLTSRWPLSKPARNLGREVVRVPVSHVRLRVVPAPNSMLPPSVFVAVISNDQRQIEVAATPGEDGLVVLPAIHDGPLDRLEIGVAGLGGKRIVVRDVRAGGGVTLVNLPANAG
jgi:hypothetical protein